MVDKGVAYWKLDGYCNNNTNILRQGKKLLLWDFSLLICKYIVISNTMFMSEFDKEATMKNQDKWFMFSEDEQKVVENHVTTR